MPQAKGSNAKLVLGFESIYKTAPVAGIVMPFNSSGLNAGRNLTGPGTMRGHRNPAEPIPGNWDVGGQLNIPLDARAMWYWLKALFGAPTTTANAANWIHEFVVANTQPSITIEHQFEDLATSIYNQYLGCKIGGFGLDVGGDGELVCNIDVVGAEESPQSASFDGSATDADFLRLNNFQASIKEGGSTLAISTQFGLKISTGLDPKYLIGGNGYRGRINEGMVEVSGNVQVLFENDTLLNKAINNTTSSLEVTVGTADTGKLVVSVPELKFAPKSPPIDGPQGLMVSLDYQGFYTDSAANPDESVVVVELYNADEHP